MYISAIGQHGHSKASIVTIVAHLSPSDHICSVMAIHLHNALLISQTFHTHHHTTPAVVVYANAHYGQGTGLVLLRQLSCTGTEIRLVDCPHGGINGSQSVCSHSEDAGVRCRPCKYTFPPPYKLCQIYSMHVDSTSDNSLY